MSSCTAVRAGLIEESCIRVVTQDHVTGPVHNAVRRIGSNIVKKEVNCLFCSNGCVRLARGNGAKSYQKLVVNRSGVVEERVDNFLNATFTVFVKALRSVCFWGELGLSAIGYWKALVWREALFGWAGMLKLDDKGFNEVWHTNATAMIRIVPFDVDASKLVSGHVALNPVKFLENVKEEVEVFVSNIFYSKVINNETTLNGTPFVAPETQGWIQLHSNHQPEGGIGGDSWPECWPGAGRRSPGKI